MHIDIHYQTIGELALELPGAVAVLERWSIDYCCHSGRTVAEACLEAGVPPAELLAEIGSPRQDMVSRWEGQSLTDLQRYIVGNHHSYTRQALQTIDLLAEKVAQRHAANHPEVLEVQRLVSELSAELLPHMANEEEVLFPYIEALEDGGPAGVPDQAGPPIMTMLFHHERANETLAAMRRGTSDYTLPEDACLSFRALYERLADLENDLHQHMHLENNLLFPRALMLEQWSTQDAGV